MPAGIITQATRGLSSAATKSSSVSAPTAPSFSSCATVSALVSYATAVCPSRMIRRTMLAPIRPRPIIPSCILSRSLFARYLRMRALVELSCANSGSSAAVNSSATFFASTLPSSTPHWSKELMSQTVPCTNTLCS